jgi:hypothetical protein
MENNTLISQEIIKIDGRQQVVKTFLNCISGLEQYSNKCLEELRYEDYILNNKYPVIPPSIPSSLNLTKSTIINGSYQVKYNNNGFKMIEVNRNINNNNIYSESIFKSISAMNEYNMNSFEEIRYQDYLAGYKYGEKELLDVNNNNNNNNHFTEPMCPICLETISNVNITYFLFLIKIII